MDSHTWRALLLCLPLFGQGCALGGFGCTAGYFGTTESISPEPGEVAALTTVTRVSGSLRCTMTCFAQANCVSAVYDRSSSVCYLSSTALNVTSSSSTTSLSYVPLQTLCNDFNDCSLSPVCSAISVSRATYTGCIDAKIKGNSLSGPYYIDPDGSGPFLIWCDFIGSDAWAVFQRRLDGSIDFYRDWSTYKTGFGDVRGEYWLGNDRLYRLTNKTLPRFSIYLEDFDGSSRTANYSYIGLSNEDTFYTLTLGPYSGDAKDSMQLRSANMSFSTYDADHDMIGSNCAANYQGAWWYGGGGNCHHSNLNGVYLKGATTTFANGVVWSLWKGSYYSLKTSIMRIMV